MDGWNALLAAPVRLSRRDQSRSHKLWWNIGTLGIPFDETHHQSGHDCHLGLWPSIIINSWCHRLVSRLDLGQTGIRHYNVWLSRLPIKTTQIAGRWWTPLHRPPIPYAKRGSNSSNDNHRNHGYRQTLLNWLPISNQRKSRQTIRWPTPLWIATKTIIILWLATNGRQLLW